MDKQPGERNLEVYHTSYQHLPFEPTQEFFRRKNLIAWLDEEENLGSVLEIGSGRHSIFIDLSSYIQGTVVEPIQEFLTISRDELSSKSNLAFFQGTFDEFVATEQQTFFSTVIISSLLHELYDPDTFLNQIKRVIDSQSSIFFVVSNRFSIHRILGVHLGLQLSLGEKTNTQIEMQQHSGSFSPAELRNILEKNGFEILRMKSFFVKLLPHQKMQQLLDEGLINRDFLETLNRISDFLPDMGSELLVEARIKL